jgi:hypothetical protein
MVVSTIPIAAVAETLKHDFFVIVQVDSVPRTFQFALIATLSDDSFLHSFVPFVKYWGNRMKQLVGPTLVEDRGHMKNSRSM